jgi:P-type Cu2+ transporter
MNEQGLRQFYDLRGEQTLSPVPAQAMRELDYQWLEDLAQAVPTPELTLSIQGLSCVGCVWLIEKVFSRRPGARRVRVDVVRGELKLEWEKEVFSIVEFARELQAFGYLLGPPRTGAEQEKQSTGLERRMGLCGAFAMNAMAFSLPAYFGMPADFMFAKWFDLVTVASATLALLIGGTYFAERSWRSLRMGALHIDTPIALGIFAAYFGSVIGWVAGVQALKYFDFVAIFTFLMLAGRWAQQTAVERNRRKLMRDTSIPESVAVRADDGSFKSRPVGMLKIGDAFQIRPAQAIPVAAKLTSPRASVSLEWINGESEAQQRDENQLLPAGALNIGTDELDAIALETWEQSTLRKLLEARKPGEHRDLWLEGILRSYLAVVIIAGIAGAAWWWWHGAGIAQALQVMISVFVVSCPCALGVAAPLADDLAVSRAEKLGVFVRNLSLWKRLARVRKVIFDKTGTLTLENPVLLNPDALSSLDETERSALRHLISGNLHPVSRSLFDALGRGSAELTGKVEEEIGKGLSFTDGDRRIWSLARPASGADADTLFSCNGDLRAAFVFKDELRSETVSEVARLRGERCMGVFVLSGDREGKVAQLAAQLGLPKENWRASMTPEEKAGWIRSHDDADTLFIGDGANDSLAFDAALCAGSPVTGRSFLEHKADFYFLGHSMRFVSGLLDVTHQHRKAVHRVFAFSVTYNVITAAVGLAGHLNPLAAAILMPLSSIATLSIVALTFRSSKSAAQKTRAIRVPKLTEPLPQLMPQ